MPPRALDGEPRVVALLGPTNTGKTHRAIETMLRYPSGVIGLPLRLLAREVYDRVSERAGEDAVALITGEERRVPANPRYVVSTVEAMPLDRGAAFVAVDEIQLCAHPERGHVFTDRLLHARGALQTMFLGSETVRDLVEGLVPGVRVERLRRYSTLSHAGVQRLGSLPPKTAVVAFSVGDVYALAERVRDRHGGAAVVMGALSPRTRNAQVAMFQAGDVRVLVATDAIGMGLNLDIDLVALSALHKFDGAEVRPLRAAEVGQIAGRAGRYRRDGRFGPLSSLGALPLRLIEAVEHHRYPRLRRAMWRNVHLDHASIDALLASLRRPPDDPRFVRAAPDDDEVALDLLARDPEVRERAVGEEAVRLLWEVCRVPDFRQLLPQTHADLLRDVFCRLVDHGGLTWRWFDAQVRRLDRTGGGVEALMTRTAAIRVWTYLASRDGWVERTEEARRRARDVEDRLSDALHAALAARFVRRRTAVLLGASGRDAAGAPLVDGEGRVVVDGRELGVIRGLGFVPHASIVDSRAARKAASQLLGAELDARVQRCVDAPFEAFSLDGDGHVLWEGGRLALLAPGGDVLSPVLKLVRQDHLEGGDRLRLERRLRAWTRDLVRRTLGPLRGELAGELSPRGRGLLYSLELGLGTVAVSEVRAALRALDGDDRRRLARMDVRLGALHVYCAALLGPAVVARRAVLAGVVAGMRPLPAVPANGASAVAADPGVPDEVMRRMGYPVVGPLAIRADMLERAAAALRRASRRGPFREPAAVTSWLGCTREQLHRVLDALGYPVVARGPDGAVFSRARRRRLRRGRRARGAGRAAAADGARRPGRRPTGRGGATGGCGR